VPETNAANYLATGFRDIDQSPDLRKFLRCLTFMNNLPSFQDYKRQMMQRLGLGPSQTVVDIGCGLGYDVIEAATVVGARGIAIGIDASAMLVTAARNAIPVGMAQVAFEVADGETLPLDDASVDAIRVDRTLQHVESPGRVITEMHRVLRPGGLAACAEPDWGTFTITSPDRDTTRIVVNAWGDSFRHGWIGRDLKPLMLAAGFHDVTVTGHLLIAEGYTAIDHLFDVANTVENLQRDGGEEPQLQRWLEHLQEDATPQAMPIGTVTLFLATGRK
jgi:ubiquinone/menaquinone biosynthesis C-methylase UbiE